MHVDWGMTFPDGRRKVVHLRVGLGAEEFPYTSVRTVPRGVRGSGVPVRSSADTGEGFGEVI